jgi:hypothetical protein
MYQNKDQNFAYYEFDLDLFEGGIEKYDLEATRKIIAKGARRLQEASEESEGVMLLLEQRRRLQEAKGGQES